jgi:hypothetical protein
MIMKSICPLLVLVLATVLIGPAAASTIYDTSLASPNTNPATPSCYYGTGCQNTGFTVSTDSTTELGLSAILRHIGPAPEAGDNYTVPLGTSGGYAVWDYVFSIDTQPSGIGSATLSSYTYLLTLTDLTTGATQSFNPLAIPDNALYGSSGAQNAEDFSFPGLGTPGFNPNLPDGYQITLAEYSGSSLVNSDTILVNADAPEPGTIFLFGAGCMGIAFLARKREAFRI